MIFGLTNEYMVIAGHGIMHRKTAVCIIEVPYQTRINCCQQRRVDVSLDKLSLGFKANCMLQVEIMWWNQSN